MSTYRLNTIIELRDDDGNLVSSIHISERFTTDWSEIDKRFHALDNVVKKEYERAALERNKSAQKDYICSVCSHPVNSGACQHSHP